MIADEYVDARDDANPDALQRATVRLERAYLGACMTSGLIATERLSPASFVLDSHGAVWNAIRTIVAAGEEPDLSRVVFELARAGALERAGGTAYVASLLDSTDCSQIVVYARLIAEAARVRRMQRV